jgi:hypothetical protein
MMNTKYVLSLTEVLEHLEQPLEVRNPWLSEQIDRAFEGNGVFLSSLAIIAPAEEWDDMVHYVMKEEGPRNMEKYNALCFLYACFILCVEGEEDAF